MKWFRLYDEIVDDPKICNMTETLRWRYVVTLCIVSRNKPRGYLPDEEDILFTMRIDKSEWGKTKTEFLRRNLIMKDENGEYVSNWFKRQYVSDDGGERVRKWREKQKERNNIETLQKGNGNGNVTDTDTETDTERYIRAFDEFWQNYPKRNGRKSGKKESLSWWKRHVVNNQIESDILSAEHNYANGDEVKRGYARDPIRFLKNDWWRDWLDPPETQGRNIRIPPAHSGTKEPWEDG